MIVAMTAAGGPIRKISVSGDRYANVGMICMKSRIGVTNRRNRSLRPARIPSGMPMASEMATALPMSTRVWIVSVHRPRRPIAMRLPTTSRAVRHDTNARPSAPAIAVRPTQLRLAKTNVSAVSMASMPSRMGPRM